MTDVTLRSRVNTRSVWRAAQTICDHFDYYPTRPAPEFGNDISVVPRINTSDQGGAIERVPDGINLRLRSTTLKYVNITEGQKNMLRRFLRNHGYTEPFYYQIIGDTKPTIWVATKASFSPQYPGIWNGEVSIQEMPAFENCGLAYIPARPGPLTSIGAISRTNVRGAKAAPQVATQFYLEVTFNAIAGVQGGNTGSAGFSLGFANSSADMRLKPGYFDSNAASINLNGTGYNAAAGWHLSLQPSASVGQTMGILLDTVAKTMGFKNITAGELTFNTIDISSITGSALYFIFSAGEQTAVGNAPWVGSSITLNGGASPFVGTLPPTAVPWNANGVTGWDTSTAGSISQTDGGGHTLTLDTSTTSGLDAIIIHKGSTVANTWFQNAWPAGTRLCDFGDTKISTFYYTVTNRGAGELNGPVDNGAWDSAVINIRTTTAALW